MEGCYDVENLLPLGQEDGAWVGESWSGRRSPVFPPTRTQLLQRYPSWRRLLPLIKLEPVCSSGRCRSCEDPWAKVGSTLCGQGHRG